jgi:hypothetical protein
LPCDSAGFGGTLGRLGVAGLDACGDIPGGGESTLAAESSKSKGGAGAEFPRCPGGGLRAGTIGAIPGGGLNVGTNGAVTGGGGGDNVRAAALADLLLGICCARGLSSSSSKPHARSVSFCSVVRGMLKPGGGARAVGSGLRGAGHVP